MSASFSTQNRCPTAHPLHIAIRGLAILILLPALGIIIAIFAAPDRILPGITDDPFFRNGRHGENWEFNWLAWHPYWSIVNVDTALFKIRCFLFLIVVGDINTPVGFRGNKFIQMPAQPPISRSKDSWMANSSGFILRRKPYVCATLGVAPS